ncbi:MAG: hypothetical protein Q8M92_04865 [Candidatus Subteraquimicrobiales bacterium]|nr:hypothetical protein [Candidatus Subteraquimicrobiales bacterium]
MTEKKIRRSKVYSFLYRLIDRFPELIIEFDYSNITKIGKVILVDKNKLSNQKSYELHNFRQSEPISFFDNETGKKVNILKEINNFLAFIRMDRNVDIILRI